MFFTPNSKLNNIHMEKQKNCDNILNEQKGIQYTAQTCLCPSMFVWTVFADRYRNWLLLKQSSISMEASILSSLSIPQTSFIFWYYSIISSSVHSSFAHLSAVNGAWRCILKVVGTWNFMVELYYVHLPCQTLITFLRLLSISVNFS